MTAKPARLALFLLLVGLVACGGPPPPDVVAVGPVGGSAPSSATAPEASSVPDAPVQDPIAPPARPEAEVPGGPAVDDEPSVAAPSPVAPPPAAPAPVAPSPAPPVSIRPQTAAPPPPPDPPESPAEPARPPSPILIDFIDQFEGPPPPVFEAAVAERCVDRGFPADCITVKFRYPPDYDPARTCEVLDNLGVSGEFVEINRTMTFDVYCEDEPSLPDEGGPPT